MGIETVAASFSRSEQHSTLICNEPNKKGGITPFSVGLFFWPGLEVPIPQLGFLRLRWVAIQAWQNPHRFELRAIDANLFRA